MKNLTVKQQLTLAFGALALLVVIVSALALRSLGQANERFSTYVTGAAERESLIQDLRSAANRRAVAVRNMVLAKTAADRDAEKAAAVKGHEDVQARLKALKEALTNASDVTERDRALVGEIEKVEVAYGPVALAIVNLASEDKHDDAIEKMNKECRPLLAALLKAGRDYVDYSKEQAKSLVGATEAAYASQRALLLAASALAVLVAIVLGWMITRRLVRALGAEPAELSDVAQRVAAGDLSPVNGADAAPATSVLASMGAMQVQLVGLIGQVRNSADSIATASAQIAQGNLDLSSRTEEQASALQQTAASMEQLGATVNQNADNARAANQLSRSASEVATKGGAMFGEVVETMKGINEASRKIADIIGVIDGIAFQTNILALNAAVEAARAGEQGRGFAVVAGEVRTLAQRSAEAAKEIKSLIGNSVERVEQGSELVDQAGATMSEIVSSIRRVTDIMGEISAASNEQSEGVAQVGDAVSQMDQATQQNAALVEESAAAADSLKGQAILLVEAVSVFKLAREAQSAPGTGALGRHTERRGPQRATNVARPAFSKNQVTAKREPVKLRPTHLAVVSTETEMARTGTDAGDWAAF